MTAPLTPDSPVAQAVRRAAVAALSNTVANEYVADPEWVATALLAESLADPSEVQRHLIYEAVYLGTAYAALIGAGPQTTMVELINMALALYKARMAAMRTLMEAWRASDLEMLTVKDNFIDDEDPAIAAYAKAADIPYALACQQLYNAYCIQ